ncbi:MAG: hypothetical protein ACYCO0_01105 [Candidatus Micrarchaeaceae archaeon]
MSLIISLVIGLLSIIVPGFFLALALLKKTDLPMFEIIAIGFIFGLIFPPTMIWLESYLIPLSSAFAFSNGLYNINVVILTIIGIVLSYQQGVLRLEMPSFLSGSRLSIKQEVERDYRKRLSELRKRASELNIDIKIIREHEKEELNLVREHAEELELLGNAGAEEKKHIIESHNEEERKLFEEHESEEKRMLDSQNHDSSKRKPKSNLVWIALFAIMVLTFGTRMMSIAVSPTYFQFDPYFDMISTQYILTYGQQLLYDHAAWPSLANGTIHRIQPIVPYLEAYWYNLAGANPNSAAINTNLLALVSSYYPPIIAALLVFAVFMFLYHDYGEFPAIIGAGLAAVMPVLITTFVSGNQLLEPWGIFALFFFYAAYILAVNNPKEKRFAVLAGIAFASNFLGAHYYTVPAAILSFYIVLQGLINVFRREDTKDFFKSNIIMLAIITLFYAVYGPYGATLTARTPNILGIPVIVSFPILALVFVALFEYIPRIAKENKIIKNLNPMLYAEWLVALIIIAILAIIFTPLGHPFHQYIALSVHFTTPSTPLFMTVQEYAPTGFFSFNFGSGGFGIIGESIGGVSIIVWAVLLSFSALEILAIIKRNSKSSILAIAAVWPLAFVGMIEVEYLPHFSVAYIIAIGVILGELMLFYSSGWSENMKKALMVSFIVILLLEALPVVYQLITAAANPNCNSINNSGNQLGAAIYCNLVPNYWLDATSWMKSNVGPYGPRILSWWDYGDWINWFGNSNAVLRGDNSVPTADYAAASHYVFGPQDGFNSTVLRNYMDSVQAKYILFDNQIVPKWGALDFLACVNVNQTGLQYAISQGKQFGVPYVLGNSGCEIRHDPAYLLIPIPNSTSTRDYCNFPSNSTAVALTGIVIVGSSPTNQSYCVPASFLQTGSPSYLMTPNGTRTNAIITTGFYGGSATISGQQFVSFLLLYAPNGPNGTITDAPSEFYNSTYYRGFFLGRLPGLTLAYPDNFTGINYVNGTHQVMIFQLNNFTGTLPIVTPKPSWIKNNYSIPG